MTNPTFKNKLEAGKNGSSIKETAKIMPLNFLKQKRY